jgi:hypothetical protein
MNSSKPSKSEFLGGVIRLLGILSICLYFTGWTYRWAYYDFFDVEIQFLNITRESFFIIPIQVFFGDVNFETVFIFILIILGIYLSLWCFKRLNRYFNLTPSTLIRDTIIISLVLAALYWLARDRGVADAYRDVVENTTTLPMVSVINSDKSALGSVIEESVPPTSKPNSNKIIGGDSNGFIKDAIKPNYTLDSLDYNLKLNKDTPTETWRLLLEDGNWLYLFKTLSKEYIESKKPDEQKNYHPPIVLSVHTGNAETQFLIRSRSTPEKTK